MFALIHTDTARPCATDAAIFRSSGSAGVFQTARLLHVYLVLLLLLTGGPGLGNFISNPSDIKSMLCCCAFTSMFYGN